MLETPDQSTEYRGFVIIHTWTDHIHNPNTGVDYDLLWFEYYKIDDPETTGTGHSLEDIKNEIDELL